MITGSIKRPESASFLSRVNSGSLSEEEELFLDSAAGVTTVGMSFSPTAIGSGASASREASELAITEDSSGLRLFL